MKIPRLLFSLALWLLFAAWITTLIYLAAHPAPARLNLPFPHFDKILHFAFFTLGATILGSAILVTTSRLTIPTTLAAWLTLTSLGLYDEIRQLHTPGRTGGDPLDLLADASGTTFGLAIIITIHALIKKLSTNRATPFTTNSQGAHPVAPSTNHTP